MRKTIRACLFACVAGGISLGSAPPRAAESDGALSFDMWCLEMQYYEPPRCDARQTDDVNQYQQYRKEVERYNDQQRNKQMRDQMLLDKLDGDSRNPAQSGEDKAPN